MASPTANPLDLTPRMQFIRTGLPLATSSAGRTICFHYRMDASGTGVRPIFSIGVNNGDYLRLQWDNFGVNLFGSGAYQSNSAQVGNPVSGTWYFFCLIYDSDTAARCYSGPSIGTDPLTAHSWTGPSGAGGGQLRLGGSEFMDDTHTGPLLGARVWSRALTLAEANVERHRVSAALRTDLWAEWYLNFDDPTTDSSGNARTLSVLTGTPEGFISSVALPAFPAPPAAPLDVSPARATLSAIAAPTASVSVAPIQGVPLTLTPLRASFPSLTARTPRVSGAVIPPMPRLGVGRPTAGTGNHARIADGAFRNTNAWTATTGGWAAIDLGTGYTSLLVQLGNEDTSTGDFGSPGGPAAEQFGAWRLQASADSTDGVNGTWTTLVTHTANPYMYRSHVIDFTGQRWLKVVADAALRVDEMEVWDASGGTDDTWALLGDSITNRATKRGPGGGVGQQPSFQQSIFNATGQYPMQMGVGASGAGLGSLLVGDRLNSLLADFPHVKHWVVAFGTNDVPASTTPLATAEAQADAFGATLEEVFSIIKENWDRTPVLATIPYTNEPTRGGPPSNYTALFNDRPLTGIKAVAAAHALVCADRYPEFLANNSTYYSLAFDNYHPNETGCIAWNRILADAVLPRYAVESVVAPLDVGAQLALFSTLSARTPVVAVGVPQAPDALAPTLDVTNLTPQAGATLTRHYPLGFDATPATGYSVQAVVDFGGGWRELAHTPAGFTPLYSALSSRQELGGGEQRFRIQRAGGWPSSPLLRLANAKD